MTANILETVHILYNSLGLGSGKDFVILCYNRGGSLCHITHFASDSATISHVLYIS